MENYNLPGHSLPVDFDYSVQVKTWNAGSAAPITVRALSMLPDGTVQKHNFSHAPGALQNTYISRHKIDSGWLLACSVDSDTEGILPGQLFIEVMLVRGETSTPGAAHVLMSGYVSRGIELSWPGVPPRSINEIDPEPIQGTIGNPAAGVNLAIDGTARISSWPVAINFTLTTDANVANRRMILQLGSDAVIFAEIIAQTVQTASLAWKYYFNLDGQLDQLTGLKYMLRLPRLACPSSIKLYTAIENIQVGDQISGFKWIYGTRLQGVT